MQKIKNSKDLIILLLYAQGKEGKYFESIDGQTRLMKMIFLFEREILPSFGSDNPFDESVLPNFEAYSFGPYSPKVYEDLEFLVNNGFVEVHQAMSELVAEERSEFDYWCAVGSMDKDFEHSGYGKEFSLTDMGKRFAQKKYENSNLLTVNHLRQVSAFKARCQEASLHQILKYVYSNYTSMTTKSKIVGKILG